MAYHIDRRIILNPDSKLKALYKWSLQEFDVDGEKIGACNWVRCDCNLDFTASELVVTEGIRIGPDGSRKVTSREQQSISAKLHPGRPNGDYDNTSYSMFGTDRKISKFGLVIKKLENPSDSERCAVEGFLSHTTPEKETIADSIWFYFFLRPDRFASYIERIAAFVVDEVEISLLCPKGFYSEWTPWVPRHVKVLTDDKEHKVEIPSDCEISPPRLGDMIEANLYFRQISKLGKAKPKVSEVVEDAAHNEDAEDATCRLKPPGELHEGADRVHAIQGLGAALVRAVNILSTARIAAWISAGLLALILITKH